VPPIVRSRLAVADRGAPRNGAIDTLEHELGADRLAGELVRFLRLGRLPPFEPPLDLLVTHANTEAFGGGLLHAGVVDEQRKGLGLDVVETRRALFGERAPFALRLVAEVLDSVREFAARDDSVANMRYGTVFAFVPAARRDHADGG
jgi:hypothetical protein